MCCWVAVELDNRFVGDHVTNAKTCAEDFMESNVDVGAAVARGDSSKAFVVIEDGHSTKQRGRARAPMTLVALSMPQHGHRDDASNVTASPTRSLPPLTS